MIISERLFFSKLLLFGEYTIITNHQALAIPLKLFSGQWTYAEAHPSLPYLHDLLSHLRTLQADNLSLGEYDLLQFRQLLTQGLAFESDIPIGYGLGSSGAISAAVYDAFCVNKVPAMLDQASTQPRPYNDGQLNLLRQQLAQIENHFHGSSSGIDPVVSYLQKPVRTVSPQFIQATTIPIEREAPGGIFILNTRVPRKTAPLVNIYLEKCKNDFFAKKCDGELASYNEDAIHAFLNADWNDLLELAHRISLFQYRYFEEMIPSIRSGTATNATLQQIWIEGLADNEYKLKLCGAGGGGFLLGFCKDFTKAQERLKEWEIKKVFSF